MADSRATPSLTQAQFADALQKGLGRIAFHLRKHGAAGMGSLLEHACLHNLAYDAQSEGTRGEWLYFLLGLVDLRSSVRPSVLEALLQGKLDEKDVWTASQLLTLGTLYAEDGDNEMRTAIYSRFDRQEFTTEWVGGYQIITLDGIEGLLHVAEVLGDRILHEPDYWLDEFLLSEAKERLGETLVDSTLLERAEHDQRVAAFLDAIQQHHQRNENRATPPRRSVAEVLAAVDAAEDRSYWLRRWGMGASDQELAKIVDRIETETRMAQLTMLLKTFRLTNLPKVPDKVLELVHSADEEARSAAARALGRVQSKKVREFAVRLLTANPPILEGVRLLTHNYQNGDHDLIESSLPNQGDPDSLHEVVLAVTGVASEANEPELTGCLLWVYEHSPCSECRTYALHKLIEWGEAPEAVLYECLLDCSGETREMARSALSLPKDEDWTIA